MVPVLLTLEWTSVYTNRPQHAWLPTYEGLVICAHANFDVSLEAGPCPAGVFKLENHKTNVEHKDFALKDLMF